jgi:hypothetical protein
VHVRGAETAGPSLGVAGQLPAGRVAQVLPPETVPIVPSAPIAAPRARTLTSHSGTERAGGKQKKATSAAMLHLLTQLLPAGRTSHYGVSADNDLHVQLYVDSGSGPGMLRVTLGDSRPPTEDGPTSDARPDVTISYLPDNCVQNTTVSAEWPDGTRVQVDVASCLDFDGVQNKPARPAIGTDEAVRIASDPRWGRMMDASLVDAGEKRFGEIPVFG